MNGCMFGSAMAQLVELTHFQSLDINVSVLCLTLFFFIFAFYVDMYCCFAHAVLTLCLAFFTCEENVGECYGVIII